jgi:hypothetical protein
MTTVPFTGRFVLTLCTASSGTVVVVMVMALTAGSCVLGRGSGVCSGATRGQPVSRDGCIHTVDLR